MQKHIFFTFVASKNFKRGKNKEMFAAIAKKQNKRKDEEKIGKINKNHLNVFDHEFLLQ